MLSDTAYKALILQLQEGDDRSIATLYDHYSGALYGVILKIIDDEGLAQEVLQDTFVKIWKNGSSFDPQYGRLFTWMMRIARNTALNKIASKSYRNNRQTDDDSHIIQMSATHNINETFDVGRILHDIEHKYQQVLRLVYFEGYTHQEVSDELQLPLGTVKTRIKIGLRHLKGIYDYVAPTLTVVFTIITIGTL